MLNVVKLSVVILSVVAPYRDGKESISPFCKLGCFTIVETFNDCSETV
jgi:hypothetical protein